MDVVVFLVLDQARWVTGQTIYVGGGTEGSEPDTARAAARSPVAAG